MAERAYRAGDIPHLARRTLWSVKKPKPNPVDEAWLVGLLEPGEQLLYRSMPACDRAHALACARHVEDLGDDAAVASALHDVGKTRAGLDTFGRVLATVVGLTGRDVAHWGRRGGIRQQIAIYLDHAHRGGAELVAARARPLAVTWAREHHLPVDQCTLTPQLAQRLRAADDEADAG